MLRHVTTVIIVAAMVLAVSNAFAYEFWDGAISIDSVSNNQYLNVTTAGSDDSWYEVASYPHAVVNGVTVNADPATPGTGYGNLHLHTDAMAMFFKYDSSKATFLMISGMPRAGVEARQWYGERKFGPGDLKIDVNGLTYGIGMRDGGLRWDMYDAPHQAIHEAASGAIAQNQSVRDTGNMGQIKLNPDWYHVDNPSVFGVDKAYAFFDAASGTSAGAAEVNIWETDILLGEDPNPISLYAYEVVVPWSTIGFATGDISLTASWRTDCGNDIIKKTFIAELPEPGSLIAILTGLIGFIGYKRRR